MRTPTLITMVLVLLAAAAGAQQESGAQATPGPASPPAQKKAKPDVAMNEAFSVEVADALLSRIAQGLTRRNAKVVLSTFDAARFPDYASFAEKVGATLEQNDSFHTYYHVVGSSEAGPKGVAEVEVTSEHTSRNRGSVPVRRQARARFEFERGAKGWRIVAMNPPDLLTQ